MLLQSFYQPGYSSRLSIASLSPSSWSPFAVAMLEYDILILFLGGVAPCMTNQCSHMTNHISCLHTIKALKPEYNIFLSDIKFGNITHSLTPGIAYSCFTLVNNACSELVIFPDIALYYGNNSIYIIILLSMCVHVQCHTKPLLVIHIRILV